MAAAALVAVLAATPLAAEAQSRDARVYLTVTDSGGRTLPLTAADVTIAEDGRAREVLRVEKASEPLQIALLVDDSQAAQTAISDIRLALKQFVTKVLDASPDTQIALISFGERPAILTDYTNSRAQLERGISRVFAREGSGAYMLEAIVSATRGIAKRPATRSHIVVVGTEGVEFSNDPYARVLDELAGSGATLWALTLTAPGRADQTDEVRNRDMTLGRGTAESGGRHDQLLANSSLPVRMNALADTLLSQYAVTYGRPDTLVPPKKIDVKVSTKGARVLAPVYAPLPRKQ
ncbi:MAG: VWA domain-containing protein [Acidobacteriota bacterium]|nr:VWA domain-containing protein [Acidobacteriota bacterium]